MPRFIYDEDDFRPSFSEQVAKFSELGSADVIVALLEGENVRAKVRAGGVFAGMPAFYRVFVDERQLHRARLILRESNLTDAELTFLATGELGNRSD